jgi:catechol 2,3-dioxygenase-like lactoylglutathione lyase family enzyme
MTATDRTPAEWRTPPPLTGLGSFKKEALGRVIQDPAGAPASKQLLEVRDHSVTLSVKDIDAVVDWYAENFGFAVDRRADFPDYGTIVIMIRAGDVRIELLHDAAFEPFVRPDPPGHSARQGVTQIQFFTDDLAAFVERVKARPDITIAWDMIDITVLRLKHFFIRDIEGNLVQISEPY